MCGIILDLSKTFACVYHAFMSSSKFKLKAMLLVTNRRSGISARGCLYIYIFTRDAINRVWNRSNQLLSKSSRWCRVRVLFAMSVDLDMSSVEELLAKWRLEHLLSKEDVV